MIYNGLPLITSVKHIFAGRDPDVFSDNGLEGKKAPLKVESSTFFFQALFLISLWFQSLAFVFVTNFLEQQKVWKAKINKCLENSKTVKNIGALGTGTLIWVNATALFGNHLNHCFHFF